MKRPSASNAEAFVRCTASHVLPQHDAYGDHTNKGNDGHALLAALINREHGAAVALAKVYPDLGFKLAELMDSVSIPGAELAYVVDVKQRKSTLVGKNIGREYEKHLGRPMNDYELGVSLDVAGMRQGVYWVRDFKFGKHHSWTQIHVQSMAVLWATGQTSPLPVEVDAGFIFIEPGEDGTTYVHEETATQYLVDLDDRAEEIVAAFDRAREMERSLERGLDPVDLKTVEGSWCQYCGAFPHCPSKWKLVKSLSTDIDIAGSVGAMTLEQCGITWKRLGEIEKNIVDKAKAALKVRMRVEGGFPLENGKRLRLVSMPGRDSLDRAALAALLRQYKVPQEEINTLFKTGNPFDSVKEVKL